MRARDYLLEIARYFQELTIEAAHVEGKEAIFFLGNTGSGKSTLICYLMGGKFYYKDDEIFRKILYRDESDQLRCPHIGTNNFVSETLMPGVFSAQNMPYYYVDNAGFGDSGDKARQLGYHLVAGSVLATIGSQFALNKARGVKAVVISIPYSYVWSGSGVLNEKGSAIKLLLNSVKQIFNSPRIIQEALDNNAMVFSVTHIPDSVKYAPEMASDVDKLKDEFVKIIGEYRNQIKLEPGESEDDFQLEHKLLSSINKQNIIMPEVTDSSERAIAVIESRFATARGVPNLKFNITNSKDPGHVELRNVVISVVSDSRKRLEKIAELEKQVIDKNDQIERINHEIKELAENIKVMKINDEVAIKKFDAEIMEINYNIIISLLAALIENTQNVFIAVLKENSNRVRDMKIEYEQLHARLRQESLDHLNDLVSQVQILNEQLPNIFSELDELRGLCLEDRVSLKTIDSLRHFIEFSSVEVDNFFQNLNFDKICHLSCIERGRKYEYAYANGEPTNLIDGSSRIIRVYDQDRGIFAAKKSLAYRFFNFAGSVIRSVHSWLVPANENSEDPVSAADSLEKSVDTPETWNPVTPIPLVQCSIFSDNHLVEIPRIHCGLNNVSSSHWLGQ